VPIVAVFEFPNESIDKYEKVLEIGGPPILEQPKRLHHVCYRTDAGWTVVDVWEDEESFAAFGEVIGPVTQQAGLDAQPKIYQVQSIVTQDGSRTV